MASLATTGGPDSGQEADEERSTRDRLRNDLDFQESNRARVERFGDEAPVDSNVVTTEDAQRLAAPTAAAVQGTELGVAEAEARENQARSRLELADERMRSARRTDEECSKRSSSNTKPTA